jgi:hypothetical protein
MNDENPRTGSEKFNWRFLWEMLLVYCVFIYLPFFVLLLIAKFLGIS